MVLGHSLRDKGATAKLVALVVEDRLSPDTLAELKVRFGKPDGSSDAYSSRPCTTTLFLCRRSSTKARPICTSWTGPT